MRFTIITFLLFSFLLSQAGCYTLDNNYSAFAPLNGGKTYHFQEGKKLPIGFSFKVIDQYYSSIEKIDEEGKIYFHNQQDNSLNFISAASFKNVKTVENSAAKILYSVSGKEGNRIFKVEWRNRHYRHLVTGKIFSVTYQVWIYEMGFFEIHYGQNSLNGLVELPTVLGLGSCKLNHKGAKYELTLEQGPFATSLNPDGNSHLEYLPAKESIYVFKLHDNYEINTLITFHKDPLANLDLYIEMENATSLYLTIDNEAGETIYTENISAQTLVVERNLDLDIGSSKKCYLNIETTEKVFITPIKLKKP